MRTLWGSRVGIQIARMPSEAHGVSAGFLILKARSAKQLFISPCCKVTEQPEDQVNQLKPIWLVEDSANDIELTLAALEDVHLANRVVVMRDGSEVVERLQALDKSGGDSYPAVIMLDIKMPKMSGIEVLRGIRADPALRQLPVVMLSSSRQGPDVTECYKLGANAYVVKPVESAEFFEAVKTAGRFWAVVNERPEPTKVEESSNGSVAGG
jgi:CheY-like chemotaxis protein